VPKTIYSPRNEQICKFCINGTRAFVPATSQVTVHRQHMSANSSIFTGHHLHLATLSAVPPKHTQNTYLLEVGK